MALYAIGDIHGCFATLQALLTDIGFDRRRDRVWLVGDLVNRGPDSLSVLRWASDLGDRAVAVLGNHDLHLLARAAGVRGRKKGDTLDEVLAATDADQLLGWLRRRPLLYREGDRLLVHAGLLPAWPLELADRLARELEAILAGSGAAALIDGLRRGSVPVWSDRLPDDRRRRLALFAFTGLRSCTADSEPCATFSGPPEEAPAGCLPWFEHPSPRPGGLEVVMGHWAAMGLRHRPGLWALDSGCVWGRSLTAVRLDDGRIFQRESLDR